MRITFVLPFAGLQGGVRVVAIYADSLARRGHEVTVISTPQLFTMRDKMKSRLLGRGWPRPEPSYFENVRARHRVLEQVRPVTDADVPDADVVVATLLYDGLRSAATLFFAAREARKKSSAYW